MKPSTSDSELVHQILANVAATDIVVMSGGLDHETAKGREGAKREDREVG
jgi:hypothetical protein